MPPWLCKEVSVLSSDLSLPTSPFAMGSTQELLARIRDLEIENMELKSKLDQYQSIFPAAGAPGAVAGGSGSGGGGGGSDGGAATRNSVVKRTAPLFIIFTLNNMPQKCLCVWRRSDSIRRRAGYDA